MFVTKSSAKGVQPVAKLDLLAIWSVSHPLAMLSRSFVCTLEQIICSNGQVVRLRGRMRRGLGRDGQVFTDVIK